MPIVYQTKVDAALSFGEPEDELIEHFHIRWPLRVDFTHWPGDDEGDHGIELTRLVVEGVHDLDLTDEMRSALFPEKKWQDLHWLVLERHSEGRSQRIPAASPTNPIAA